MAPHLTSARWRRNVGGSRAGWLVIFTAVVVVAVVGMLSATRHFLFRTPPPPPRPLLTYQQQMEVLKTKNPVRYAYLMAVTSREMPDDEKYQVIRRLFRGNYATEQDFEFQLKSRLQSGLAEATLLQEYFPGLARRLQWTVQDLELAGPDLDRTHRRAFDVLIDPDAGPPEPRLEPEMMFVNRVLTIAECNRALLKMLTGRDFATSADFQAWFNGVKGSIRWNSEKGVFEVPESPATQPAGVGVGP
jgi:hypothetical protein